MPQLRVHKLRDARGGPRRRPAASAAAESQDYLNTAFEDWGEESQLYQGGNKSKVLRTTYVAATGSRRKGRKKKESAALSPRRGSRPRKRS